MKIYITLFLFFLIFFCFFLQNTSAQNIKPQLSRQTESNKKLPSGFLENSSKQVTTISRKSWSEKFSDAFYLCIIGFILFVCSFPSLWFNERRAVRTSELITEGFKICQDLKPDEVKPENNGRLVFLSGMAENQEILKDEELGVCSEKTLKLKRIVEMYQWKEIVTEEKERDWVGGGETTKTSYHYKQVWNEVSIDSGSFRDFNNHVNPSLEKWVVKNETFLSKASHIGNFDLSIHQIEKLACLKRFPLQENSKNNFSEDFLKKITCISTIEDIALIDNYIYIKTGQEKQNNIGDLRISFEFVPEEHLSLVSCQNGNTFIPYNIRKKGFKVNEETQAFIEKREMNLNFEDEEQDNCCKECSKSCACCYCCLCCGFVEKLCKTPTEIDWLYEKPLTKQELFDEKEKENMLTTWTIRVVGFFMMVFGIYLFFSPVYEILEILPLLSSVGKFVVFVFALLVSIPICSLIIMLAWIFYRPMIALIFLFIIIGFGITLFLILSKSKSQSY